MKTIYSNVANQNIYPFVLPDLPFNSGDVRPYLSLDSFEYHHGKHHNAYVENLNKLLEGTQLVNRDLEDVIIQSYKDISLTAIFNNAAQVWNHSFFWHCIAPKTNSPSKEFLNAIIDSFNSMEAFKENFVSAGISQFGSGWVWLVLDQGKLKIVKTSNAQTPLTSQQIPLLCCDVWEHAYYIDFKNKRPDFLKVFVDHLANWEFVSQNYTSAIQK